MTPEEIVAAAQRGEPVADYLEDRLDEQVRFDIALAIREHRPGVNS